MCYLYLHQGKPFLKHLELKTCGWHKDRHSENFHCKVWAIIKILVSSCKELRSYVTLRRASSSYRLHVHTFNIHTSDWNLGPQKVCNTRLRARNMEDEEHAQRDAYFQEELESLKTSVARLTGLLEQTLRNTSGEGPSNRPVTFN